MFSRAVKSRDLFHLYRKGEEEEKKDQGVALLGEEEQTTT
jgi:hypothetical protein